MKEKASSCGIPEQPRGCQPGLVGEVSVWPSQTRVTGPLAPQCWTAARPQASGRGLGTLMLATESGD